MQKTCLLRSRSNNSGRATICDTTRSYCRDDLSLITDQGNGMGEGAAQDVANLSELHPQDIRVKNLHFHGLVLPAPLLVRDCH